MRKEERIIIGEGLNGQAGLPISAPVYDFGADGADLGTLRWFERDDGSFELQQYRRWDVGLDGKPGKGWAPARTLICPLLKEGVCSQYLIRPFICRLWGLTQHLKCPYGCTPDRWLSEAEAHNLALRVMALGF